MEDGFKNLLLAQLNTKCSFPYVAAVCMLGQGLLRYAVEDLPFYLNNWLLRKTSPVVCWWGLCPGFYSLSHYSWSEKTIPPRTHCLFTSDVSLSHETAWLVVGSSFQKKFIAENPSWRKAPRAEGTSQHCSLLLGTAASWVLCSPRCLWFAQAVPGQPACRNQFNHSAPAPKACKSGVQDVGQLLNKT